MAWGQGLDLPVAEINLEQINSWLELRRKGTDIETAPLRLDGRRLFVITAPHIGNDVSVGTPPIDHRVTEIESRLYQFISRGFDPNSLEVTYQTQNGLPIIFANGRALLTVTTEDAAIYGVDLETRAEDLTTQLKEALIRAQRERQPDFLKHQIRTAIIISGILFIISYFTFLIQRCIQKRRQYLAQEAKAHVTQSLITHGSQQIPPIAVKTALKHSPKHKWQQLHG
jgi:small conductance mechanosensitive channel